MADEPSLTPLGGGAGQPTTYRVARPHAGVIPLSPGQFEATEYADPRTGWRGRVLNTKDAVIGSSMSNTRLLQERISKKVALAVFSSDALSSTAYASQEILLILVIAGAGTLTHSLPIATAITALLVIVVISYRQLIRAYPNGGGAYTVALENLGKGPGLTAAAALLIDYTLTVAVSIAACVEALASAIPAIHDYAIPLAIGLVALIAVGNLRGIRESGTLFAIPTYGFVLILGATIVVGVFEVVFGNDPNLFAAGESTREVHPEQALTLFLVLRAFSAGCAALTGVEAISNGVSAFKPPEWKNAISTMTSMAFLLAFLFLGTTLLARHFGIVFVHGDKETVMSQVGEEIWGRSFVYYVLQAFTAGILFLAANTAYSGFPLLGAILARDGFLPRAFHQRGNRLVFSYGIAALTGFAILFLVGFNAETTRLIPLYALGVFLCFTLAQAGMVRLWLRRRDQGWQRSAMINGFGGLVTGIVFGIILITKFAQGGWMVVVIIPLLTLVLWAIGRFYVKLKRRLFVRPDHTFDLVPRGKSREPVFVPVEEINLPTVMALSAACDRSSNVTAVHVNFDAEDDDGLIKRWDSQFPRIPLVVIASPFRTVAEPLAWYVNDRMRQTPNATVILPVIEVRRFWQRPLVNQSLRRLPVLLKRRKSVEFIEQPFALS
ncbi:MAG: APC family permease [Dehalococcoidia bacterium]